MRDRMPSPCLAGCSDASSRDERHCLGDREHPGATIARWAPGACKASCKFRGKKILQGLWGDEVGRETGKNSGCLSSG